MKRQAFNPFLPSYEYIPDGEPYVFDGRVYVYGSHDCFDGVIFCLNDYVCWSAPVDDLADWRYEGVIYRKNQDPMNPDGTRSLYAPDVQRGADGRYYLYYAFDDMSLMSVAVCDSPAGAYEYYGTVRYPDGRLVGKEPGDIFQFDPGVFMDDDERVYLFSGFAPIIDKDNPPQFLGGKRVEGAYCMELEPDMLTVKAGPSLVVPGRVLAKGTGFEAHPFLEASSMRKIKDKYYFIYSSVHGHELCYATAARPDGPFEFGGVLVSNGDVGIEGRDYRQALSYMGNNHGSLVQVNGQWYIFYHRQTNKHSFSRQACAEPVEILPDGSIRQAEMTSCGLNGGPLRGLGRYEARIACNLVSVEGAGFYGMETSKQTPALAAHPYFTQSGEDREENGDQYIAGMQNGAEAGFKYFTPEAANRVAVQLRGEGVGEMLVLTGPDKQEAARIPVRCETEYQWFSAPFSSPKGDFSLYFRYQGAGYVDFALFELSKL